MKAEELMIGNIILSGKHQLVGYVKSIFGDDVLLEDKLTGEEWQPELKDCAGIPLTEEWLVKFGFTRHCRVKVLNAYEYTLRIDETNLDIEVQQGYQGDNNRFRVNLSVDGEEYAEEPQSINNAWLNHIRYVHQLQNLYFALTGEELKLTASQSNQIE